MAVPAGGTTHIPNTASAAFTSRAPRFVTKKMLTADIEPPPQGSTAGLSKGSPQRRSRDHANVFRSGSPRFRDPVALTKDVEHHVPPGVGAIKTEDRGTHAFKATSKRWSSGRALTADVEPYVPQGISGASARGVGAWARSKSPRAECQDSSGYAPRFKSKEPLTAGVDVRDTRGLADMVDTSRPHPQFKPPSGGREDRFRQPRPVTAGVEPYARPGLADDVLRGKKGHYQPKAGRWHDRAPLTRDVEPHVPPGVGSAQTAAKGVVPMRSGQPRFHAREPLTAGVEYRASGGIADAVAAGTARGVAQPRSARFGQQRSLTADVEPVNYSSFSAAKAPSTQFRSRTNRFTDPKCLTKDVDTSPTQLTIAGRATSQRDRPSAAFRARAPRFRQPRSLTSDVDFAAPASARDIRKSTASSAPGFGTRADRFNSARSSGAAARDFSTYDGDTIAGRVARRASSGAPGLRSKSPRFRASKSAPAAGDDAPVRGLAHVICENKNTYNTRYST